MAGHTALLVVHGIGAQQPGDTVGKLLNGFRTLGPDTIVSSQAERPVVTVGGCSVRLYEVYWADILKGDVTHQTFLMNEFQSLSWFPWLNLRCGLYRGCGYSILKLAWWCIALPIANFLALFAYYGTGLLAQIFDGIGERAKARNEGGAWQAARDAADRAHRLTLVDRVLDEYAADVFSYVNSAANAFYREAGEPPVPPHVAQAYGRIVERFHDQLVAADRGGCDTIQIVAHSLGTVVAYHALSGFSGGEPLRADAPALSAAKAKVSRLYTIGSPLEKIRFFWPRVAPRQPRDRAMRITWDNFVSFFDPVSGMIRTFDDWGAVANHRLVGGGFFLGHVVYERSAVFLAALTAGLCGHAVLPRRGFRRRLRDALTLTGEMLAEPIAIGVVLALGAALFLLTALLLPYLLSWVLRLFLSDPTRVSVTNVLSLICGASLLLAFSIAPKIRAGKAHAQYWAGTKDAPQVPVES